MRILSYALFTIVDIFIRFTTDIVEYFYNFSNNEYIKQS